jgi:membrane protease YdiL (CAAX protease family)
VGLVPVLFTVLSKEDVSKYGVKREGFMLSTVPSVLFVFVVYGLSYFLGGQLISFEFPQFQLSFPWNLWYVFMGLLAYGPLEVYFIIWLIENTDRVWGWDGRPFSTGVGVTVAAFALMHILSTRSLINSVNVSIIFLFFGLVYKYTGNSVGPMIAWTLVNRQALLAASVLFY